MGHLRRSQNRLTESRIELETAIALDSNDARALFQLGMTLMYVGQPEAAIPRLEEAMRLNPRDPNVAQYNWGLGACHLLLNCVEEAIDFLRRACAANPWHHYPPLHLAAALGLRGNIDEAIQVDQSTTRDQLADTMACVSPLFQRSTVPGAPRKHVLRGSAPSRLS